MGAMVDFDVAGDGGEKEKGEQASLELTPSSSAADGEAFTDGETPGGGGGGNKNGVGL